MGHSPRGLNHIISANNDKDINIVNDAFLGSNISQEKIKQIKRSGFSIIVGWREIGEIGKMIIKIPKRKITVFLYLKILI